MSGHWPTVPETKLEAYVQASSFTVLLAFATKRAITT